MKPSIDTQVTSDTVAVTDGETDVDSATDTGEAVARLFDIGELATSRRSDHEARIRALCCNAYLGEQNSLCRVLGRYKMFVDTADVGHSTHLLLDGYWEMWTTELMQQLVRPGMTVVDAGANLGYFTLLLADLVGPDGRVLAFEPNPHIARRLRQSVAVNGFAGRTAVHDVALGDAEREVGLVVPAGEPKNAHVVPAGEGDVQVHSHRLDSYGVLPDFIKIDVEGAEMAVWQGMTGILAARKPLTVVMEFVLDRYDDPGLFLDEMLRHGLDLSRLTHDFGLQKVSREEVLAAPAGVDQLLVLMR
jgi:FkbM family methyltransferase